MIKGGGNISCLSRRVKGEWFGTAIGREKLFKGFEKSKGKGYVVSYCLF